MSGHLFIIDGDITQLSCDAWLLPSDRDGWVTKHFAEAIGLVGEARLDLGAWPDNGMILHTAGTGREPDIWIGDVGRSGLTDLNHYGDRAAAFIASAASRIEQERSDLGRAPLLALPVIGSDAGGGRSRRGDLLATLILAIATQLETTNCDVTLVCFGPVMLSAAKSAARAVRAAHPTLAALGFDDLSTELQQEAQRLGHLTSEGKLVVFFGAGASIDAGIPGWDDLLKRVAERAGMANNWETLADFDPRDKATIIRDHSPDNFNQFVAEETNLSRYGLVHGLLASLPTTEYVTTNFDVLFEKAASTAGRQVAVIPGDEVKLGERWLLKLHGTLGGELVFTRSDYISSSSSHSALRGIVQAMLLTRHMLFVGYSLRDDDFHQLVHEVRTALGDQQRTLGTALLVRDNEHLPTLWPEIDVVSTGGGTDAGRRVALFLDLMASTAASSITFVADDSFGELRSDHETRLNDVVKELAALHDEVRATGDGREWPEVENFLGHFGKHR
ncbi:MAG: SIR2 family protein [Actinomycetota bacterium]|nr:SIR2 family protein [Actinomycetota bacterium]